MSAHNTKSKTSGTLLAKELERKGVVVHWFDKHGMSLSIDGRRFSIVPSDTGYEHLVFSQGEDAADVHMDKEG